MKRDTIPDLERVLALQLQTFGESREVADTTCMLGDLFLSQNNPEQAKLLYQRALGILEGLSDHGSHRHVEVKRRLEQLRVREHSRRDKQPAMQQPVGNQQAVQRTATQGAVEQPSIKQPSVKQSSVEQLSRRQTEAKQPSIKQPSVNQSSVKQASRKQTDAKQPRVPQSSGKQSFVQKLFGMVPFLQRKDRPSPFVQEPPNKRTLAQEPQQSPEPEAPAASEPIWEAKITQPLRNWDARVTQQMRDPEVEAALAALLASVDSKMASSFKVKDEILDAIHDIDIEIKFHRQEGGEQIVALADLLTQRADLQCRARLYQEAEISLREALSIRESSCGPDHYSVSTDLANLARVYHVQELYDEAEPLLKRAILLRKKLVGSEHLKVGELERQYAKLLRRMNRLIEAEAVEMHVAKIYS